MTLKNIYQHLKRLFGFFVATLIYFNCAAQIPQSDLFCQINCDSVIPIDQVGNIRAIESTALSTSNRFNQISKALYFDGDKRYVDFGKAIKPKNINNFSVSFWILPSSFNYSPNRRKTILGNAGNGGGWRFYQHGKELHFTVQPPADLDHFYLLKESDDLNWLHVVGVSDGDTLKLYVNGQFVKKTINSMNQPYSGNLNLELARGSELNSVYWKGKIDDIRMYNDPLSSSEIDSLYNESNCESIADDQASYVSRIQDKKKIQIFPNPFKNEVNIEIPNNLLSGEAQVSILALDGKKLYSTNVRQGKTRIQIPNKVASGLYILHVSNSHIHNSFKIRKI